MARRLRAVEEPKSLQHYRNWSAAKSAAKEASGEVGLATKQACDDLEVTKKAFNFAANLRRMDPTKAGPIIRDLKKLCQEWGVTDENFDPVQSDLEEAIRNTEPAA